MGWMDGMPSIDRRVARLIDANLDRAREGLRVVEDWCRFGLERDDLVIRLKDWRHRLGRLHCTAYKQARSVATDPGADLGHPAQLERRNAEDIVVANCGRVQEALRVLEEYCRLVDPSLASEATVIRYGLYDLELTCLNDAVGAQRRQKLNDCHLCLITTPCPDLIERVGHALRNGVAMVQYRCKHGNDRQRLEEAKDLRALCQVHGALFLVNDRIDLALALDADGVHLGQDDLPTSVARALIGDTRLLGRSTHSIHQLRSADVEPCDYLGLGPVHKTSIKPERAAIEAQQVAEALSLASLPLFAIGGIHIGNVASLRKAGCRRIAVISAIMNAEDPGLATQQLLQALSLPPN
ncbi:thiamine phosphate synthase [Synechococcus sp. M16CYN]|uniref:thiamine phosphate synthase n=1 Tax=Synechococcus sp. M16CYN TaxID=3103139 RepID=UPI0032443317